MCIRDRYYYHGVSHYLGAETHDIGRYGDRRLEPGMVLTVEPGLYIDEYKIGIRIEDDVLAVSYTHLDVYKRQPYILNRGLLDFPQKELLLQNPVRCNSMISQTFL